MTKAAKTLDAINTAIEADQGAKFRGLLGALSDGTGDAYKSTDNAFRSHLGASIIGRDCSRALWYSFHWAKQVRHSGRILRLFNRGHLEEPRFVALLQLIGCAVWQTDLQGKQFKVSGYRGHFGGSIDGVVRGLPEMPDAPVLVEFKTHGDKAFKKLQDDGLQSAKWEHFIQMQIYMGKLELEHALYMAVNKNDDDLYAELIKFDPLVYERSLQRSETIIDAITPPPRINENPGWYKCKFCDYHDVCHASAPVAINCRTCTHIRVADAGRWECSLHGKTLSTDEQLAGCPDYLATLK